MERRDLNVLRERMRKKKELRQDGSQARVVVHMGTCGLASGAREVWEELHGEIARSGRNDIDIACSGCIGLCSQEPLATVEVLGQDAMVYGRLNAEKMRRIFSEHVIDGRVVSEYALFRGMANGEGLKPGLYDHRNGIPRVTEFPFFALQRSWVLRNRGRIDPDRIEDYIWRDGYRAAARALLDMKPQEIIDQMKASGLRGRGGGGFPTGIKWEFCANARGDKKYVLCNADEGDPGAFMDRSVMEGDPHAVLEGMIIAARAIGSDRGYIYCRAEYPLAVEKLERAICQARERGLLGRDILGSGFHLDIEVYQGAGAFVCGEETALMTSIEGRRGMPRPRPPFPALSGLWKKPTVLNNVETYANVPQILLQGAEEYARMGTESSKGTKVFALTGKVENVGLVEIPMGMPLGQIIFDLGGGIPSGKKFKAAQLGGPSGGCLPAEHLNTPTDYEAVTRAGAIMGSGGLIVMDEDTCMVDMARYFMDFCQDESCGKCTPCRVGTKRMLQILERICRGQGREGDIELLEDLAASIKDSALCGLGQTAPNPVLSTIRYFRDEYQAHIRDKRCPAVVCSDMFQSPCQHACPLGMDIPAYVALVREGRVDDAYRVLKRTNPFPAVCGRVCPHPCQDKCKRGQLDEPLGIRNLKRFVTDNAKRSPVCALPITRPEKVAIVGAGPSGLTAAWELRKRGYAVTVFEAHERAGGMLRWGIPAYRLPREILDAEIQDILDSGVELRTATRIGRELSLSLLVLDFDAVYLAVGAQRSVPLEIPGEDAPGVWGAVEFLASHNRGEQPAIGKCVAVVGGGNSAIDAARTAVRLGAGQVTVCYRRERKDMPAQPGEIRTAQDEGVVILELVGPTRIATENGRVTGLELIRMGLGPFDRSGRRSPVSRSETGFTLEADTVIVAVGQRAELDFIGEGHGIETAPGTILVNRGLRTLNPKIWAGGDAVTGPATVIAAIRAGRDVARSIDASLRAVRGEKPFEPARKDGIDVPFGVDEEAVENPQAPMPEEKPAERRSDFREVERGYDPEMAKAEACRCMRCDVRDG